MASMSHLSAHPITGGHTCPLLITQYFPGIDQVSPPPRVPLDRQAPPPMSPGPEEGDPHAHASSSPAEAGGLGSLHHLGPAHGLGTPGIPPSPASPPPSSWQSTATTSAAASCVSPSGLLCWTAARGTGTFGAKALPWPRLLPGLASPLPHTVASFAPIPWRRPRVGGGARDRQRDPDGPRCWAGGDVGEGPRVGVG